MSRVFRILKIAIALVLVALSLWSILLPPYFPSSSHAVVNTRKVQINSQTDGIVQSIAVGARAAVTKGQVVANVEQDQSALKREVEQLRFLEKRLQTQLANTELALSQRNAELEKDNLEYAQRTAKTVATLSAELSALTQKKDLARRELELMREEEDRMESLVEKGIVTRSKRLERSKLALEAEKRLQAFESESLRVADSLDLAKAGLHVAQTESNDALTSEIASLQHEIRELKTQRGDLQLQLTEAQSLIKTNSEYLSSLESVEITSPSDGMVWMRQAVDGQNVSTGQSLVQLADRDGVFVESFFHRYYQDTVFPGDHAFVQLRGDGRLISGKVVEVKPQEHGSNDLYVVNSVAPSSSMLRVVVEINGDELSVDEVGKLGKVVVTSSSPGVVNRSLVRLTLMLRNQQ
ncbi:HlyD family secretion protein [Sulfuriroseicoccus oceanibius]|uniref:HlyD family efflux transporter periplasmic adaptor subunit n=1 Tax=Sulfuriroseicoccus oceanibius TaxID=2707525 RepID=A0A6B3L9P8_9BACT|nr:HlyD family efflux transporter periplasmic adaptor subunit [Sulfuriroseicoccus oceanibius]QQL44105.1 HlyD family efflux transporter periplasmic adaptor subunit [Sulfuriroseicoccus oceanibius]